VYFVTIRQLLAWMSNPVPASGLDPAQLGCGQPGGAGAPGASYVFTARVGINASDVDAAMAAGPSPAPAPAPAPAPGETLVDGAPDLEAQAEVRQSRACPL
jgi:hypothetical protein